MSMDLEEKTKQLSFFFILRKHMIRLTKRNFWRTPVYEYTRLNTRIHFNTNKQEMLIIVLNADCKAFSCRKKGI